MAGKRPASKGKTIAFIPKGSNSPPSSKISGSGYGGAPVLHETNRGERTLASRQPGSGRMFPPVHGGGKPMVIQTKKKLKGKKGAGYVPAAGDVTNSPNPF